MELQEAIELAKKSSKSGYVQHVCKTPYGYWVSDWFDSERTVISFENGEEIQQREK